MAVSGAKWFDFVIYAKAGVPVEQICFDPNFWQTAVHYLNQFYYNFICPNMLPFMILHTDM